MSTMSIDMEYQLATRRAADRTIRDQERHHDALSADLQESLIREKILLGEKQDLSQRQILLTKEFEHRLINSLQMIVSMLSLQSRAATVPEAAAQLMVAARRVGAFGRVHHRLHLLDEQDKVQFKPYLVSLCEDLSSLLLQDEAGQTIVVEGDSTEISTASAIPLGFIVSELITNSAKYARGNIKVRLDTTAPGRLSLAVLDDGPGLPDGFDIAKGSGLGMKIVRSLVKQIYGEMDIMPGENGRGACFRITWDAKLPQPQA